MAKVSLPEDVKAQVDAMREAAQKKVVRVTLDLEAFTAANVDAYLAANRLNDIGKITKAMIPFILDTPDEWGEAKEASTYENLDMPTWKQLSQHIAEIINYMTSKN